MRQREGDDEKGRHANVHQRVRGMCDRGRAHLGAVGYVRIALVQHESNQAQVLNDGNNTMR